MSGMLKLANKLDKIARTAGLWVGWIIIPLIFVIMFDVITRKIDATRLYFSGFTADYGFSVSTILQDLQWHFHALLLMFSFGIGYLYNAHVRVDIFREMLSRRKQGWMELIGLIVLGLPFLILMIKFSGDMVALSWRQGEGSDSMTGIPMRYIPKSFMVLGFLVVLAAVLATIFRLIGYLFGDQKTQDEAIDGLAIFSDQSTALAEARREAEMLLEKERMAEAAPSVDTPEQKQ
jgi:TRAP-type mannitol/chloroaromatic compound transport system permease small subunit